MARKKKPFGKARKRSRRDKLLRLFCDVGGVPEDDTTDPRPKTLAEWTKMPRRGGFTWRGQAFRHGDDAQVYSVSTSDDVEAQNPEKWIAHIIEIRCKPGTRNIWVHVRWYHSAKDMKDVFSGLRLCDEESFLIPENERVYSDREQLLYYQCFQKVVTVVEWYEEGSATITPDTLYTRFSFGYYAYETSTVPYWEVGPGEHTCVPECYAIYHPFLPREHFYVSQAALHLRMDDVDYRPNGCALRAETMHFCPRNTCRRWFHRSCLRHVQEGRGLEQPGMFIAGSRPMRRLALDPQSEREDVHLSLAKYTFPQHETGKMSHMDLTDALLSDTLEVACGNDVTLPSSLINVAAMPIIRRADPQWQELARKAPQVHFDTVDGNMSDVLLARKLLLQQVEFTEVSEHLRELCTYYEDAWTENPHAYAYGMFVLESSRIVASVHLPYWNRIEQFYVDLFGDELDDTLPYRCPTCAGPI